MYIKVLFGDVPRENDNNEIKVPSEVLVNPDCPIRVIYDYVRKTFQVDDKYEIDLCDDTGSLTFMYEKEHWMQGLNLLVPKTTYYLVLFEKDEDNRVSNPLLYLPEFTKKSSSQWNDLMGKIRKQLNPSFTKPSRMSKTRTNTSHMKMP